MWAPPPLLNRTGPATRYRSLVKPGWGTPYLTTPCPQTPIFFFTIFNLCVNFNCFYLHLIAWLGIISYWDQLSHRLSDLLRHFHPSHPGVSSWAALSFQSFRPLAHVGATFLFATQSFHGLMSQQFGSPHSKKTVAGRSTDATLARVGGPDEWRISLTVGMNKHGWASSIWDLTLRLLSQLLGYVKPNKLTDGRWPSERYVDCLHGAQVPGLSLWDGAFHQTGSNQVGRSWFLDGWQLFGGPKLCFTCSQASQVYWHPNQLEPLCRRNRQTREMFYVCKGFIGRQSIASEAFGVGQIREPKLMQRWDLGVFRFLCAAVYWAQINQIDHDESI